MRTKFGNYLFAVSVLFFVGASAHVIYGRMRASELPVIMCDQVQVNWGTVPVGSVVEHTFRLRNEGRASLLISDVKPGCGCTLVEAPTGPMLPGEVHELTVHYPVSDKVGKQRTEIAVHSNDPGRPVLVLAMHGEVSAE